jgi:hypothetical protein
VSGRSDPKRQDLAVLVLASGVLCALDARLVERLVLDDEVERASSRGPIPTLRAGKAKYGAFSLGAMLGRSPDERVWVLMHVSRGGEQIPVAFGAHACVAVEALPPVTVLPPSIFADRSGGMRGAFLVTGDLSARTSSGVGLYIDPSRFLSSVELQACSELRRGDPRTVAR